MPKYVLTLAAEEDLRNIFERTLEHWGPVRLTVLTESFESKFSILAKFPDTGRRHNKLAPHILYAVGEAHYIFYKVIPEGIEIIRLLHHRMDVVRHLPRS